jgi:hypothetical protein
MRDILRVNYRSTENDCVNKKATLISLERVWLPKTDTDPNTRMENFRKVVFSRC